MNIQNMERLLLIAEEKNISAASKKLFISQPTLSTMISSIEKEIGIKIFDRQRKQLKLTPAGERYIRTVKKMLVTWYTFKDEIRNVNEEVTRKIKVGITERRSIAMFPSILPLFFLKRPIVGIKTTNCITSLSEPMLAQNSVDLVFSNQLINLPNIRNIRLLNEVLIIASHKKSEFSQKYKDFIYNGKDTVAKKMPFSNLNNESLILLTIGEDERMRYQYMAEESHISNFISVEVFSSVIAQNLVENNLGTAILPKSTAKNGELLPRSEDINYFFIDSIFAERQYYLNYDAIACNSEDHKELIQIIIDTFGYHTSETI